MRYRAIAVGTVTLIRLARPRTPSSSTLRKVCSAADSRDRTCPLPRQCGHSIELISCTLGRSLCPRQFEQAEAADAAHLNARAIRARRLLHALLDGADIPPLRHVDEIDDDKAGEVAQSELAGDFGRRLQIGLGRRFLDIAFARRATGIDIDGHQSLGRIDHDVSAGRQCHFRGLHRIELAFHLVAGKEGKGVAIGLHALGVARHERAHERFGRPIALVAFHEHFLDFRIVEIPDRALDEVGFLVDQRRRRGRQGELADFLPEAEQVAVIAFDLRLVPIVAGGAQNHRHAVGKNSASRRSNAAACAPRLTGSCD